MARAAALSRVREVIHVTDAEIVERVRQGEVELFAELHSRYYRILFRFARRYGHNADAADDLVSEAFLRAYRALPRFESRGEESFLSFLFRIVRNLAIDQSRRRSSAPALSLDDPDERWEALLDGGIGVEERVFRRDERRQVRDCLAQLPPADREIILLAYDEELSGAEIRELMGKPSVSAVTSHLHRAIRKLRARLAPEPVPPDERPAPRAAAAARMTLEVEESSHGHEA